MKREDFEQALRALLAGMTGGTLTVRAGDLHRAVGGYPGRDHRMPVCCAVMRAAMAPGDEVLAAPPSGLGASLTIRYRRR